MTPGLRTNLRNELSDPTVSSASLGIAFVGDWYKRITSWPSRSHAMLAVETSAALC